MKLAELVHKLPAVGVGLGAIAWGTSTELNYALAPKECVTHLPLIPVAALVLALLGLAGTLGSLRAWRGDSELPSPDRPSASVPHKLLAGLGVLAGALFTAIIVMQGLASLFLTGCE